MSLLGPSWLTFAGSVALAFAVGGAGGFLKGVSHQHDKEQVLLLRATEKARQVESNWQSDAQTIEEVHADELRRVAAQHVRDLAGVRRDAKRLSETATCTADGAGATGRQLSQSDADFLVWLAADADRTSADLRACQAWVKAVKP